NPRPEWPAAARAPPAGTRPSRRRPARRTRVAASFDDLVGSQQNRGWHVKSEGLGGLEIEDRLKFCRQLNRQVGGLRPLENPRGIEGSQSVGLCDTRAIADQATGLDKFSQCIDRRHTVARCKPCQLLPSALEIRFDTDQQRRVVEPRQPGEYRFELALVAR